MKEINWIEFSVSYQKYQWPLLSKSEGHPGRLQGQVNWGCPLTHCVPTESVWCPESVNGPDLLTLKTSQKLIEKNLFHYANIIKKKVFTQATLAKACLTRRAVLSIWILLITGSLEVWIRFQKNQNPQGSILHHRLINIKKQNCFMINSINVHVLRKSAYIVVGQSGQSVSLQCFDNLVEQPILLQGPTSSTNSKQRY